MALQNLHEMIRNLSTYIKSLEVLCESGLRLAKNFERLLSPGQITATSVSSGPTSTSQQTQHLDGDLLSSSVITWELTHKVATVDSNALISELLPLLQETVQNVMKDATQFHSSSTNEVFRSCFSAFFQIQWRFCSLYLQCSSSTGYGIPGYASRTPPDFQARSPTTGTFSFSSGDRRESTESCMSSFSLPRSSISGLSSMSSRSASPSFQMHHPHHVGSTGHNTRSRNSSPSVKFTPSQPPSPLLPPFGESGYPSLFRRWSAQTHTFGSGSHGIGSSGLGNTSGSSASGSNSTSTSISALSSFGCGSGGTSGGFNPIGFCRRWSVPAGAHNIHTSPGTDSSKINEDDLDYGLLDAINLLSAKPPSPTTLKITPVDDMRDFPVEQSTSLWPASGSMPGVVVTACTIGDDALKPLESLQVSTSPQSLRVPNPGMNEGCLITQQHQSLTVNPQNSGEYSLFGGFSSSSLPRQEGGCSSNKGDSDV